MKLRMGIKVNSCQQYIANIDAEKKSQQIKTIMFS